MIMAGQLDPKFWSIVFPNLFGKWCRPNYNSAVATFCNNLANDLPIQVNDRSTELELLYIDDLVSELLDALEGKEHHCEFSGTEAVEQPDGRYCYVPVTHRATLGEIVDLLETFRAEPDTLVMPQMPEGSFSKKHILPISPTFPEKRQLFR